MKCKVFLIAMLVVLTTIFNGCGKKESINTNPPVSQATQIQPNQKSISKEKSGNLIKKIKAVNERGNTIGNIANYGMIAQQGDWIYYSNQSDGEKLYKIKTDGTNKQKLDDEGNSYSINIAGDWIYYVKCLGGTYEKFYKIKTDGTGKIEIK